MAFALVITSSVSGIVQHPTSQVSAAVLGSGNQLTVAEGNYNSLIHWGRVITKRELQNSGFYVDTRY